MVGSRVGNGVGKCDGAAEGTLEGPCDGADEGRVDGVKLTQVPHRTGQLWLNSGNAQPTIAAAGQDAGLSGTPLHRRAVTVVVAVVLVRVVPVAVVPVVDVAIWHALQVPGQLS